MATCTRCNRGLKDPASIQKGFGPVCWAKVQADIEKEEAAKQQEYSGPYDGGDIILERRNGTGIPGQKTGI